MGEAAAARTLERAGVRIVARNARTRYGEIDLIGRDRRGWVFVEVKTRRRGSFVSAQEAVTLATEQYISGLYGYNVSKAALARSLGGAEDAVRRYLGGSR